MLWLPFYIHDKLDVHGSFIANISMIYDAAGIFGCWFGGWLSDKLGIRSPVVLGMTLTSLPLIFGMREITKSTIWLFYLLIPLIGITVSGVNGLVAGAVAADLGYTPEL